MNLFKPAWKNSNPDVRRAALKKITNQAIISDIMNNDPYLSIRLEAATKLDDESAALRFYTEFIKSDHPIEFRYKAACMVSDDNLRQLVYDKIVYSYPEDQKRIIPNLTDEVTLKKIKAYRQSCTDVYEAAHKRIIELACMQIDMLTDIDLLISKAKDMDEERDVRNYVINKINDQKILCEIAIHYAVKDTYLDIFEEAVNKINDQKLLHDVAVQCISWVFLNPVIRKMTDQNYLLKVNGNQLDLQSKLLLANRLISLGWVYRTLQEEGCSKCNGTHLVYVPSLENTVDCECGLDRYSKTVRIEKEDTFFDVKYIGSITGDLSVSTYYGFNYYTGADGLLIPQWFCEK